MKRLGTLAIALVLLLSAVVAISIAPAGFQTYVVRDHQTMTQLLWNRDKAYLVVGMRRDGWSGSPLDYAWQVVRGAIGVPFSIQRIKNLGYRRAYRVRRSEERS